MRDELRQYLDGDLAFDDLSTPSRAEAEAWETFLSDLRRGGPEEAPADLEASVMKAVEAEEAPWLEEAPSTTGDESDAEDPVVVRMLRWLVEPRPVPVPPAAAVAAALVLLLLLWPAGVERPSSTDGTSQVYVEFVMQAPGATSVAVAGDFTGWEPEVQLEDPDGDGVWSGRAPLRPGVHEYMFVIDGNRWVTDPNAQRYASDGFGNRNAVLAIAPPSRQS